MGDKKNMKRKKNNFWLERDGKTIKNISCSLRTFKHNINRIRKKSREKNRNIKRYTTNLKISIP